MPDSNKVFDQDKNVEMHQKQLETIAKNTDIGSSTLKILTTLIEALSNLSPTNLPSIATKIAGLANPLADAIKDIAENKIDQVKNKIEIPKMVAPEQLDDLDKINPIKSNLDDVDYVETKDVKSKTNIPGLS